MTMIDLVRRARNRLEAEYETAIERGAQKRSLPFYEYVNGKVLFDNEAVIDAREGLTSREGEGDFIRSIHDSYYELGDRRLVPAFTFDKEGQPIVVLVIQP